MRPRLICCKGASPCRLSRALEGVVQVARVIGVQYLCIGALCIMQGFSGGLSYGVSMMQKYLRTAAVVVIRLSEVASVQDGFLDPPDDKKAHTLQNYSVERSRYLEIPFIAANSQSHVIVSNPTQVSMLNG